MLPSFLKYEKDLTTLMFHVLQIFTLIVTSIPTLSVENHLRDMTTSNRKVTKCNILITDEKKRTRKKQLRNKCKA